nr:alpha/beta hydrolase [uncultured Sphingomonas sp.]
MKLSSAYPTQRPRKPGPFGRRIVSMARGALDRLPRIGLSLAAMLDWASRRVWGGDRAILAASAAYGPDPRQMLDVWVPANGASGPLPIIIFFYGGGWESGERRDFGFVGRALAAKGFIAVLPDYRRLPDHVFPSFVEDGAAAVRWATRHAGDFGGDPSRIAVSGHSAGAHLAALIAYDPRYGVVDHIRATALLSGPFDFDPMAYRETRLAMGDWPDPAAVMPVHFARADAPPTLLITGTGDVVVRARNSQSMARTLAASGAEVEVKLYRGQTHSDLIKSFSPLFRHLNPVRDDVVAFLHRVLEVRAGPAQ